MASKPKRCAHRGPKTRIIERGAYQDIRVLWCHVCGALKAGLGPWWHPSGPVPTRKKGKRRGE